MLDYSHNVLLIPDVAQFSGQKGELGDDLKAGKPSLPYAMYNGPEALLERYQYRADAAGKTDQPERQRCYRSFDRAKAPGRKSG
ncbi:hypothetical protein [Dickeya fangzhongdai]|uniref:hypothetical protein n=1 Tax=Dickeya fangzhongdai TaxID=1778540 RepID=UPI0026E099BC|nr:hypothetical protein [Dickeya fangzhongdai]